jgi:hypothetical protein
MASDVRYRSPPAYRTTWYPALRRPVSTFEETALNPPRI